MLFWRKKKKKKFDDEQLKSIVDEYLSLVRETVEGSFPRQMRRALSKSKEWRDSSRVDREEEIKKIHEDGLNNWLTETMQETYEGLGPYIPDAPRMEEELKKVLKEFKQK